MITEFIKHIILKKLHPCEPAFVNRAMNIVLVLKIVELAFEKKIACENRQHFATLPLISPQNDV